MGRGASRSTEASPRGARATRQAAAEVPPVRWTSLGRRLLVAFLGRAGETVRGLAARCGTRPATIGMLATGRHRDPSLRVALALERVASIDPHAWDVDSHLEDRGAMFTPVNRARAKRTTSPPRAA